MRREAGLPWSNIGKAMGLTDSAVRGWIARGYMPQEQAQPLANVLRVTVGQLTGAEPWAPAGAIPGPRLAPEAQAAPEAPQAAEAAPELAELATASMPTILARIASLAHQALGEPDLAAELVTVTAELGRTKAELAQTKKELGESNARLDLMREALAVVDDK
jgi:hypothetical protein